MAVSDHGGNQPSAMADDSDASQQPTPDSEGSNNRRRQRGRARIEKAAADFQNTLLASLILVIFAASFGYIELDNSFSRAGFSVLIVAIIVLVFYVGGLASGARDAVVSSKEADVASAVQSLEQQGLSTLESAKAAMRVAVAREELGMAEAGRRSNALYRAGFCFMLFSVLAPLGSAAYYWNLDPLPSSVVQRLAELHRAVGVLPAGTTIPIQRDWRVIVGGISFGFLFLAAASGLMKQHGRQTALQAQLGRRVSYFQRVELVVGLRAELGSSAVPEQDREIIDLVTRALMARDDMSGAETWDEKEDLPPMASTAVDVLKLLPAK
jgi:outer membrane murein-binding lipoprotein Lpp